VLSGDDVLTLPLLAIGGKGVISTSSNIAPGPICELVRAFRNGDLVGAQQRHYALLSLFDVLFCETNPIPVKAAAAALGWCSDEIRLPLTPLTQANHEQLRVVLKDLGILQ
jgi:4-hydroxy-tetrahydrodipicolinate synthase